MEIYKVTYKQLSAVKRQLAHKSKGFVDIGIGDYQEIIAIVAMVTPDTTHIEQVLTKKVTSPQDSQHWLYVTNIEWLGSALFDEEHMEQRFTQITTQPEEE